MRRGIDPTLLEVADAVISELYSTDRGAEALATYHQHRDGDVDFVFIEEAVSSELDGEGDNEGANYELVCGIVFAWLKDQHGVNPPAWYVHYLTSPSDCRCGNIPSHMEARHA